MDELASAHPSSAPADAILDSGICSHLREGSHASFGAMADVRYARSGCAIVMVFPLLSFPFSWRQLDRIPKGIFSESYQHNFFFATTGIWTL